MHTDDTILVMQSQQPKLSRELMTFHDTGWCLTIGGFHREDVRVQRWTEGLESGLTSPQLFTWTTIQQATLPRLHDMTGRGDGKLDLPWLVFLRHLTANTWDWTALILEPCIGPCTELWQ